MVFCNKCGKEIDPQEKFCNSCGAAVENVVAPTPGAGAGFSSMMKANAGTKPMNVYIMLGLSALGILFLLLKWMSVGAMGYRQSFGIFGMFDIAKTIGELGGPSFLITMVAILFLLLTIANIAALGFFGFKLWTDADNAAPIGKIAFGLAVLYPIIVYITLAIANGIINSKVGGFLPNFLSATATPIFMILVGLAGFYFVHTTLKKK